MTSIADLYNNNKLAIKPNVLDEGIFTGKLVEVKFGEHIPLVITFAIQTDNDSDNGDFTNQYIEHLFYLHKKDGEPDEKGLTKYQKFAQSVLGKAYTGVYQTDRETLESLHDVPMTLKITKKEFEGLKGPMEHTFVDVRLNEEVKPAKKAKKEKAETAF